MLYLVPGQFLSVISVILCAVIQITELAGYTARVSQMFRVFKEVSEAHYVRNSVHTVAHRGGHHKHHHQKDRIARNQEPRGRAELRLLYSIIQL